MKKPITVYKCKCERCGATWISRVDNPKRCARCKSPYWNRKRQIKQVGLSKKRAAKR